jgi:hypothetical protein
MDQTDPNIALPGKARLANMGEQFASVELARKSFKAQKSRKPAKKKKGKPLNPNTQPCATTKLMEPS